MPAGEVAIIEKQKDHHSTLYIERLDAPNMQRITWKSTALHGGPLPVDVAASHGCARMPYDFAEKLFDKTWIGMRVIISPPDAAPVEFSHLGFIRAESEGPRGCCGACRSRSPARPQGHQNGRRGEESRREVAVREAASLTASLRKLGMAQALRRRRARVRRQSLPPQRPTKPRRGPRS